MTKHHVAPLVPSRVRFMKWPGLQRYDAPFERRFHDDFRADSRLFRHGDASKWKGRVARDY